MSMRTAEITVTGVAPLLLNNPQMVDRFNHYAKRMASINAKKAKRTDDDYVELRELEMKAKLYFDKETGVYVPATGLSEAIATRAFRVAKISRDDIRSAFFSQSDKLKLHYRGDSKVKDAADVHSNPAFVHSMAIPQGKVRVVKAFPIFHEWRFASGVEFDDKIIDPDSLSRISAEAGKYGGFGDFRPTFGRAVVDVRHG